MGATEETWGLPQPAAALRDQSGAAARRAAAAELAWHYAVELVAEAGASKQRAEELRRGVEARRLRAAPGGSGA